MHRIAILIVMMKIIWVTKVIFKNFLRYLLLKIGKKYKMKEDIQEEDVTERTDKASDLQSPKYEFIDWQSSLKLNNKKKNFNDDSINNSPKNNKEKTLKGIIDLPFVQTTSICDQDLFNQTTIFKNSETNKHYNDKENQIKHSNSKKSLSSSRGHKDNQSISPPKNDKLTSLEYRLVGANKTIKVLEKDNRLKDEKIQELIKELEKKNKLIDMQQVLSYHLHKLKFNM